MTKHLKEANILLKDWFGFREGKNTIDAIYELAMEVATATNETQFLAGLLCHLFKADNCLNYNILLVKFKFCGCVVKALELLVSYTEERKTYIYTLRTLTLKK